jgi:hypothetical protein
VDERGSASSEDDRLQSAASAPSRRVHITRPLHAGRIRRNRPGGRGRDENGAARLPDESAMRASDEGLERDGVGRVLRNEILHSKIV